MTPPDRSTRRSSQPLPRASSQLLLVGILALTLGVLLLAALRFVPGSPLEASSQPGWAPTQSSASKGGTPSPTPTPTPTPEPIAVSPAPVTIDAEGWVAWAMLDLRTGKFYGSSNMSKTNGTASLIKAWIAADYLRQATPPGQPPTKSRLNQISIMIRDSDNEAASSLWSALGGQWSTKRMIKICKLTDSTTSSNWSQTKLSPRDIARLGACIQDGRAAGPKWTKWLLKEMRLVRGVGDFGIRKAFPTAIAKTISIKNGWVIRDETGQWNVNCLAIGDGWTMGVTTRYPASLDYTHGAKICESVAAQLRDESYS